MKPTQLRLQIVNDSADHALLWYQSTLHAVVEPSSGESIRDLLHEALKSQRSPQTPTSVLTPITSEPLSLFDIDRMVSLRDKFRGERIFVMGNGPSLNRTPLELLRNEYVFGVNRVSLLFERVSWRPTFFTAFDVRVVPDNKEEFAALDIPYKFFSARYKTMLGERQNHYWYHTKGHYEGFETAFEPSVVYSGFGGGGTIGVIAIELAFYLGFRQIYLIGTDVSYSIPATAKQSGADEFGDGVKLRAGKHRGRRHEPFRPSLLRSRQEMAQSERPRHEDRVRPCRRLRREPRRRPAKRNRRRRARRHGARRLRVPLLGSTS